MRREYSLAVALLAGFLVLPALAGAQKVSFEPVRAPSKGPENAKVTVYEVADFMWPFCKEAGPAFKKLNEEFSGKIRFVLVPYIRQYSNQSRDAALAAWAAWDQGKFWEMHDLLFEKAPELDRAALDGMAKKLGLDMAKFAKAMDGLERLDELKQNLDRLHALDIWSTPTVIINGEIIKGLQPYENYRAAVAKALSEAGVARAEPARDALQRLLALVGPREAYAEEKVFGQGKVPLFIKVGRAKPTNEPKVGEEAPDFTLPGIFDQNVTLSSFRGKKNVLLTFLPAAFTPVWTGQLSAYEELKPRFTELDTQVLGVLTDNIPSLKAWAQGANVSFPILSDFWPHGMVSLKYDVLRSEGIAERAIFVIDKAGVIRYIDVHDINEDPGMNAILKTLEGIQGGK